MNPSSSSSLSCSKRKRDPECFDDEPNSCKKLKHDVFINYSFEDVGNNFISHLQRALDRNAFIVSDHTLLPVGKDSCLELLKAIQESEIFVIVFSTNYASSLRCLDELVDIMDCFHKVDEKRKVFPVFFKVDPGHVRTQQGPFMEAFQAYQTNVDPERVKKWKQALKEVGQLSGVTFQNGDEADFILKIVKDLEKMQSPQELHVTDHPVGVRSRAQELISKLRLDCIDHVLVVAVYGISGIGKTTIVKETYNRIVARFDVSCFLSNIHHLCQVPNWKVDLPKELISCLTRNDKFSIMSNHNESVTKIKRLVSRQKVLLVLDDVDNVQQLEALGINPAWFYKGSRIIVTTRDKRSLGDIPYASYHTMLLNRRESLSLFTRLMFTRDDPVYTKFIEEVVSRAGGLPLVLKVWSRHFKQFEREEWPSVLETLKRIPHGDVHNQLKMSYDSLTNRAKKLFLDIACFFYGYSKDLVVKVLQDEETAFFPKHEIQYLVDKCLVEITDTGSLTMHHAIREMGQEIVRQENEDEPGQRTRLRDEREVTRLLTECSGTESVESIILSSYSEVSVQVEVFRKMSNLRLIQLDGNTSWINSSHDERTPLSFKKLKYMVWECFPFKRINDINMSNVVVLRLFNSKLEILWQGNKSLKKLRILDVADSLSLTETGDFYGLENLEELYFKGCKNLKELHSSINCLHKLAILDLSRSISLKRIPWEMIVKLPSIRELKLSNSETISPTPSLVRNNASNKAHMCKSLVSTSSNVPELKSPKTGSEDPQCLLKVIGLRNLSHLCMSGCSVSQIPDEIGNLVSLKGLDLSENTFSSLPDSFSNLSQLATLNIVDCSELRSLPLLPSNLTFIIASRCWSLDVMPYDTIQRSYIFRTKVCKESTFSKPLAIHLPMKTKEIPDWCNYRKKGGVLSFMAPTHICKTICGIILYANNSESLWALTPKLLNKTKNTSCCLNNMELRYDSIFVMFYPLDDTTVVVEAGDTVALEFPQKSVLRCGLCLIYDTDVVDSKLVIQHVNDIPDDSNLDDESNDECNPDEDSNDDCNTDAG